MTEPAAAPKKATMLSDVQEVATESNGEMVFDVAECPVCGESHSSVPIKQCKGNSAYTHWYLCPSLGDPVFVAVQVDKGAYGTAHKDMVAALQKASSLNAGMLGIVIYKQGRTLYLNRVRDGFPVEDLEAGMHQLQKMPRPDGDSTTWADLILMDLEKELGPPPQQPLPTVKRSAIPKRITLFDSKKDDDGD